MYIFHWSDYLLFSILLIFYALFGIYFKVKYQKKLINTKAISKEYFLANRSMTLLPVSASILVSFMSAISILGTVAEVYLSGIEYGILSLSYFIAFPLSAYIYLPIFYRNNLTSIHEYLEQRFSKIMRTIVGLVFTVQSMAYMSVVLYAPALAFSQVSGLPLWVSILSTGAVCTFYTALGGLRAVIWTDLVQFVIMLIGLLSVITFGIIKLGGAVPVWNRAKEGGRLHLFNFDPDPFRRHSFWTLLIGGTGMCMTIYATNQAQVQRYLSCKTEKIATRCILLNIPLTLLFNWLLLGCGVVVYATFAYCDPIKNDDITKVDQIFPFFVMKMMSNYYPLPGLFLSTIFAAALSTVSSGINSLSTVIIEDIWLVWCDRENMLLKFKGNMTNVVISIVSVVGLCTIGMAFLFIFASPTVLQIALSLFGVLGGPSLAAFTMGLLLPYVNKWGALFGYLVALIVNMYLGIKAIIKPTISSNNLPRYTTLCLNTSILHNNFTAPPHVPNKPDDLYNVSYLYYTLISMILCFIVSLLVSMITGWNTKSKVKSNLLNETIIKCCRYIPTRFPEQICREIPSIVIHQNLASNEVICYNSIDSSVTKM